MRRTFACLVLAACTSHSSTTEKPAFTVTSSDLTIMPGEETTKCFYFHTPNTTTVAVNKWVSDMTPGSHHMIFFTNLSNTPPADGTIDDCNSTGSLPLPVFFAQEEHKEIDFPTSDGTGIPLAQNIEAGTAAFFQMHYLNTTDQPITTHVTLSAYAMPVGKAYTRTDLFGTYNADIAIPPGATNYVVSATCPGQAQTAQLTQLSSYQFWWMTSHSHKQSISVAINDGANNIITTNDWQHPQERDWAAPSFFSFSSSGITWACTYNNTGSNAGMTVVSGQSAATNEMCMAAGYYFPAAGPRGCFMHGGSCTCFL